MATTRGSVSAAANAASTGNAARAASQAGSAARPPAAQVAPTPPVALAPVQAAQDPAQLLDPTMLAGLDPAIAAQIAGVGPALVALAAAFAGGRPGGDNGSQQTQDEPEDEPGQDPPVQGEDGADDRENEKEEKGIKVDLRNIKMERFDSTVPPGSFDAKAHEFCEELAEQMDNAQALAGQIWDEELKKAIFIMYLTGMARRWYRERRAANPAATYADGADALVHELRPILLGVDIAERIKKERKRWNETYREFSDRLLQMADALEGGKSVPANARHALVAFVRNAYAKYTDFLETKVNLDTENPEEQLKYAVSVLSRKAETDGRAPKRAKPKTPPAAATPSTKQGKQAKSTPPNKKQYVPRKDVKKRPAEANAAVIERKKKPRTTNFSAQKNAFKCYECGANGHTADSCRTYLQGNKNGEFGKAAAQSAEANSADHDDEDEE